jgi:hypothetical protein
MFDWSCEPLDSVVSFDQKLYGACTDFCYLLTLLRLLLCSKFYLCCQKIQDFFNQFSVNSVQITSKKTKPRGLGPQANYTDQVTAACRRT